MAFLVSQLRVVVLGGVRIGHLLPLEVFHRSIATRLQGKLLLLRDVLLGYNFMAPRTLFAYRGEIPR